MGRRCKFFHECKAFAVTEVPYSKMPVCKHHFLKYVEDRVWKTIQEHNLIELKPEEKVLVAVSGGKDSSALLTILDRVLNKRVKMEALYIEVGIAPQNYSHDSEQVCRRLTERLNIPLHVVDIKKEYGFSIDDIHELGRRLKRAHHGESFRGECSYCGLIKRYLINRFAILNGFTKVATGHNLTDEATTLLGNFFNVDMELMSRAGPITITESDNLVPRIKPLYYIYENETILYAYYANVEHLPTECAYSVDSPMLNIKRSLDKAEELRRGTMMNMVKKFQSSLKPILFAQMPEYKKIDNKCRECGMTTYLEVCAFCKMRTRILEQMNEQKKKSESISH